MAEYQNVFPVVEVKASPPAKVWAVRISELPGLGIPATSEDILVPLVVAQDLDAEIVAVDGQRYSRRDWMFVPEAEVTGLVFTIWRSRLDRTKMLLDRAGKILDSCSCSSKRADMLRTLGGT